MARFLRRKSTSDKITPQEIFWRIANKIIALKLIKWTKRKVFLVFFIYSAVIYYIWKLLMKYVAYHNKYYTGKEPHEFDTPPEVDYILALTKVVSMNGTVLLSLVDELYVAMAINFYITSLKPYDIRNYLMVTMDKVTCHKLSASSINCLYYRSNITPNSPDLDVIGSDRFNEMMNIRTDLITQALEIGISVLHCDVDVTFTKYPLKYIPCRKSSCHMATLLDEKVPNAGFALIHPSALPVYRHMQQLASLNQSMDDQTQLHEAIRARREAGMPFNLLRLPVQQFQYGKLYYENGKRMYADSAKKCGQCIVIHNNWIIGIANKVYRAKELHQWNYDADGYYSSTKARYITYTSNPSYNKEHQLHQLKMALLVGQILNRIVILPKFYCKLDKECALHIFLDIMQFDHIFGDVYREHSFLSHKLVPQSVKLSTFVAGHLPKSLTDTDIISRFKKMRKAIIKFDNMDLDVRYRDDIKMKQFNLLVEKAFVKQWYRFRLN